MSLQMVGGSLEFWWQNRHDVLWAGHASSLWLWAQCWSGRVRSVDERPPWIVLQPVSASHRIPGVCSNVWHEITSHDANDGDSSRPRAYDSGDRSVNCSDSITVSFKKLAVYFVAKCLLCCCPNLEPYTYLPPSESHRHLTSSNVTSKCTILPRRNFLTT